MLFMSSQQHKQIKIQPAELHPRPLLNVVTCICIVLSIWNQAVGKSRLSHILGCFHTWTVLLCFKTIVMFTLDYFVFAKYDWGQALCIRPCSNFLAISSTLVALCIGRPSPWQWKWGQQRESRPTFEMPQAHNIEIVSWIMNNIRQKNRNSFLLSSGTYCQNIQYQRQVSKAAKKINIHRVTSGIKPRTSLDFGHTAPLVCHCRFHICQNDWLYKKRDGVSSFKKEAKAQVSKTCILSFGQQGPKLAAKRLKMSGCQP